MDTSNLIAILGVGVTVLGAIVAQSVFFGRKFQILEDLSADFKDFKLEVKNDFKGLTQTINRHDNRLTITETLLHLKRIKADEFAPGHSPRKINEKGRAVIKDSGVWRIIEKHIHEITEYFRLNKPTNMYDAQNEMLMQVKLLSEKYPEEFNEVKDYAFKMGYDFDLVLFLGGLKLRDHMFPKIGFKVDLLDK